MLEINSTVKRNAPIIKTSMSGTEPMSSLIFTFSLKGQVTNSRYTRKKGSPHYAQEIEDNIRPLSL